MAASTRTQHARELFAPLGPTYDRYARLLSFGQDPRWRRFLVSRIPAEAVRVGLPLAGAAISPGWHEVGRFLGPNIRGFYERLPLDALVELWRAAGIEDVRYRRLSVGGGIVVWGTRS